MKRKAFIAVILLSIVMLSGCDVDVKKAAADADSAVRNIGYKGKDVQNDLNEIVDKFKEDFGNIGEQLEK